MDKDDTRKRKKTLNLDSPTNPHATKRKRSLQPHHVESEEIITKDEVETSLTLSSALMESNSKTDVVAVIAGDEDRIDIISRIPPELSHVIFSCVGPCGNAMLVCKRWKAIIDNGITSGVLFRRELAMMELKPFGVKSLDITKLRRSRYDSLKGTPSSIPDSIGELTNLRDMRIEDQQLTKISDNIGALSNLVKLHLYRNQLVSIPATIGALSNLRVLNLSANRLASIPATIGDLSNLKELRLNTNHLVSIPATIGALANLELLDLSINRLKSIPEDIGALKNLKELQLHRNQLTPESIPPALPSTCRVTLYAE